MGAILIRSDSQEWKEEEFFKTGEIYCDTLFGEILSSLGLPAENESALDFGCGIGRLSRALASRFEHVTGVDVSRGMIKRAREMTDLQNVSFLANRKPDLSLFPDGNFSFVISVLVLQHMSPEFARKYIVEFLRVLRPGGTVVFQIPVSSVIEDRGFLSNAFNECRRVIYRPRRVFELSRRLRRLLGVDPHMLMTGLSEAEITQIVSESGGTVLKSLEDGSGGSEVRSLLYVVRADNAHALRHS